MSAADDTNYSGLLNLFAVYFPQNTVDNALLANPPASGSAAQISTAVYFINSLSAAKLSAADFSALANYSSYFSSNYPSYFGAVTDNSFYPTQYVCCAPCSQYVGSGPAKNIVRNKFADIYASSFTGRGTLSDAQAWANSGFVSSVSGTGGQLELSLASFAPDMSKYSTLVFINIKGAAPGANTNFLGQGNGATGAQGWVLQAQTDGKINLAYISASGTFGLGASNGVFFDGSEHSLAFLVTPSGHAALFKDGEINTVWVPNTATPLGATTPTEPFTIGGESKTSGASITAQYRGIHILQFSGHTVPLNIGYLAKWHFNAPHESFSASTFKMPSKVINLFWAAGQSNESGSGNTVGMTGNFGLPFIDTANGRSVIPALAEKLARRGILAVWNPTAYGSTSIAESWCGRIRNWANNTNVCSGSYILNSGILYKCANSLGFSGTSTVAPAVGTGADGVTWVSLGAPTTLDTSTLAATGVYDSSSPRFDPNGLVAAAKAKSALVSAGISAKIGLISIGQQDRFVGTTLAQYSQAIQNLTAYYLANGATNIGVGMTVRSSLTNDLSSYNGGGANNSANTTSDNWYNTHLLPGRLDALSKLSGAVFPAHDWATYIGAVTNRTVPILVGVKSADSIHMTDITYETLAAEAMDYALTNAGF